MEDDVALSVSGPYAVVTSNTTAGSTAIKTALDTTANVALTGQALVTAGLATSFDVTASGRAPAPDSPDCLPIQGVNAEKVDECPAPDTTVCC